MTIKVVSEGFKEEAAPAAVTEVKPEDSTSAPVAKATEQKQESTESDTEETEETEAKDEADESAVDETEGKSEESEKEEAPKKKKSGWQRRIDKLNKAKSDAQREADYWKSVALKGADADKKAEPVGTEAKTTPQVSKDGKPKADDFETHAEFVEALTEWKVVEREKAREAESQKTKLLTEQEQLVKTYSERLTSFKEKATDWEDVMSDVDDIRPSVTVERIILKSENGPELAYELAKNRSEFERINKLDPTEAALELGMIKARLVSKTSEEKKPEQKKLTKAPKPLEPVGAGKGAVSKSLDDPSLTQSEYEAIRREQMKRRNAS